MYAALGNDRVQELIDQICAAYEHGGGGQARILQMGPDGLPMGAPVGAIAMGQGPPGGGGMGGMPPPMGGAGAPSKFFKNHQLTETITEIDGLCRGI